MASATVARSSTRQKSNRAPLGSVIVSTVSGLTGSPFRANVRAEAGGFCILKGQPRHYVKTGDSGAKRIHAFCEVCASPIYSCAIENPQSYTQRTGLYCNGMSWAGQCGRYGRSGVSPGLHPWPMCVPEFEGEA